MHGIAGLLDALLPVLHEVTQSEQGIVAHGDLVFRRPGFHGYQDDARVQLLLVDLLGEQNREAERRSLTSILVLRDRTSGAFTHSVGHVHHRFGKVLGLRGGTTPLDKLQK